MKGKLANGVGSQYPSHYLGTWCIQHYYCRCAHFGWRPTADLNGLVRFAERRNLVSARVPSHFNWPLHKVNAKLQRDNKNIIANNINFAYFIFVKNTRHIFKQFCSASSSFLSHVLAIISVPPNSTVLVMRHLLTPWFRILLEKLTVLQLVKKFPNFMETEGSLPHSQVPATCPYPDPSRSSPSIHIPLPEDPS